jgi:hypothetical protein
VCMLCMCRGRRAPSITLQERTMATATTNSSTKTTPTIEIPETAQKIREQMLSSVKQGQQVSIDAAQGWVKAVSVLPVPDLDKIPGVPAILTIEAATRFTFDVAADVLNAQRDYALQLVNVLAPAKSV